MIPPADQPQPGSLLTNVEHLSRHLLLQDELAEAFHTILCGQKESQHVYIAALNDILRPYNLRDEEINELQRKLYLRVTQCQTCCIRNVGGRRSPSFMLKHSAPGPGLCELVAGSRIYIEESKLNVCKGYSRNYMTLGRMLAEQLFKPTPSCARTTQEPEQPALALHVRDVVFSFLKQHGRCNNWGVLDDNVIRTVNNVIYHQLLEIMEQT